MPPQVLLKLGQLKGIPYEPEDRGDGNPNIGFLPIKGRPHEAKSIPEARDEPGLIYALTRLNAHEAPFFTAGCEKCYNFRGITARPIGYVEFVHNSIATALEEDSYWRLAEEFDSELAHVGFALPVEFEYIVSPTRFSAHGFDGYSAAVYVKNRRYSNYQLARRQWRQAIHYLTDFLCSQAAAEPPLFYGPVAGTETR